MAGSQECIFCKIIAGVLPCSKVYEDDEHLAFKDTRPKAPIHYLIVPKVHTSRLDEKARTQGSLPLGKLLEAAVKTAEANNLSDYRLGINVGARAGQEVFHTHIHLLSGW